MVVKATVAEYMLHPAARGDLPMAEGSWLRCTTLPAQTLLSLLKVWVDLHNGDGMGTDNVEVSFYSASSASKETDFIRAG